MATIHTCDFCDKRIDPSGSPSATAVMIQVYRGTVGGQSDGTQECETCEWLDLCSNCFVRFKTEIKRRREDRVAAA